MRSRKLWYTRCHVGFLKFWNRQPIDLPTRKQLSYAKKLGIPVGPKMSEVDISTLIDEAERSNPRLKIRRENAKQLKRESMYSPALLEAERKWNELAEQVRFILAIYKKVQEHDRRCS